MFSTITDGDTGWVKRLKCWWLRPFNQAASWEIAKKMCIYSWFNRSCYLPPCLPFLSTDGHTKTNQGFQFMPRCVLKIMSCFEQGWASLWLGWRLLFPTELPLITSLKISNSDLSLKKLRPFLHDVTWMCFHKRVTCTELALICIQIN